MSIEGFRELNVEALQKPDGLNELNRMLKELFVKSLSSDDDITAHKSNHENGGSDEISATGLSGLLADTQHSFVGRGDATDYDFETAALTTDGAWHDLDLSSIVPAGAKAVLLLIIILDNATNSAFLLRENGNTREYNVSYITTQVANIPMVMDAVCSLDSNRVIEYKGSNLAFTEIDIIVKGWWL
jgi:hypothetical protein